jgi:allantoinase
VVPGNSDCLKEMVTLGLPGFKCFLIHSGVDEFPSVSREQVLTSVANNINHHLLRLRRRCCS